MQDLGVRFGRESDAPKTGREKAKVTGLQLQTMVAVRDLQVSAYDAQNLHRLAAHVETLSAFDLTGVHAKERIVYYVADFKRFVARVLAGDKAGLKVIEINAGERLRDVELSKLSIEAAAVPVEDAVGRVRVLLDFEDDIPRADGV